MSKAEQLSQEEYLKRCQAAANKGNVVAQNTLGFLYLNGQGIEQSDEAAVTWFRRAADDGYAAAQYNLAGMYKLAKGLSKVTLNRLSECRLLRTKVMRKRSLIWVICIIRVWV